MVVSGFTCIDVTVEISSYRRCRNIFHINVIRNARTKLLRRDTSRDDCRTPFLIYTSNDGRGVSRDDRRNLHCRDVNRDDRKLPFLRDAGRDSSMCTTVEMPL